MAGAVQDRAVKVGAGDPLCLAAAALSVGLPGSRHDHALAPPPAPTRAAKFLQEFCPEFVRIPGRGVAGVLAALLPGTALACALPPSVVLTLPTGHYITAAALTVAVTALLAGVAQHLPALSARQLAEWRERVPVALTSSLSFLIFLALIGIGLFGDRDPMHNLLTLLFWVGVWIVLPLASMLFGDLWRGINPWTGPVRIMRILLARQGGAGLSALDHWPAVLGYLAFAWFQMISLSPDDPAVLAQVLAGYWLVIFVLAVAEGEDWLQKGEFIHVLMGMISRIAPLWREVSGGRVRLMAGLPGAQVLRMAPLTPSGVAFITLALAALTFDGLSETFWWQGIIGQNPLEPLGRSAVVWQNTAGLLAVWAVTALAILGMIALGRWLSRPGLAGGFAAGPVMLSFLVIAAGYHAAHYLIMLLTAGQYVLAALNDPFLTGDSLLGLPPFYVSFGFLTDPGIMPMVYGVQFAAILGAHLLAVLLALKVAGPQVRALAHLPLGVLMVGYTVLGLWILSTARVG